MPYLRNKGICYRRTANERIGRGSRDIVEERLRGYEEAEDAPPHVEGSKTGEKLLNVRHESTQVHEGGATHLWGPLYSTAEYGISRGKTEGLARDRSEAARCRLIPHAAMLNSRANEHD